MRRASGAHNPGVSLFPFLAVLICTMGVMMLLLVIINRPGAAAIDDSEPPPGAVFEEGGKGSAATIASGKGGAASAAGDELQSARDMLNWRLSQLQISREKTLGDLRNERMRLTTVEDGMRKLRDEWRQVTKAAGDIEQADQSKDHDKQTIAAFVDRLKSDLNATHERLGKAINDANNQPPAYAIVPYDGPNGTRRQPIYIECRDDAVVLQPEGISFTEHDFQGPKGPGNPLASTIRAARDYLAGGATPTPGAEPYPLLIVRSDGIEGFYMARSALSSWASEYGYELIEADRKLAFQPPNPQLAQVEQAALTDARARYAWFATTDTAKEEERPRARPVYRASRNGGGVVREGEASLADADGASTGGASAGSGAGNAGFGNSGGRFGDSGTGSGFSGTSGSGNGNGTPGTGNGVPGSGGATGASANNLAMAGGPGSGTSFVPGSGYIGLPGSGATGGSTSGSGYGLAGASRGVPGGVAGGSGTDASDGVGNGAGNGVGNSASGPAFVPGNGYIGLPGSGAPNGTGNGSGNGMSGGSSGIPGGVAGTGTGGQSSGYLGLSGGSGPSSSGYGTGIAGGGTNDGSGVGTGSGISTGSGVGPTGVAGGPTGYGTGNPGTGNPSVGIGGSGVGTGSGIPSGAVGGNGATGYGSGVATNGTSGGSGLSSTNSSGAPNTGYANTGYSPGAGASGTSGGNSQSGSSGATSGNSFAGQSGSTGSTNSSGATTGDPSSMPPGSPIPDFTVGQGGSAGAAAGAPDGSGGDAGTPSPLSMLSPTINPQPQHTISDLYNTNATPYPLQSGPTGPHPGEYVPSQPAPSYSDKPKPTDDNAPKSHDSLAEKRGHNWSLPSNAKLSTPVSRTIHIECRGNGLTLKPDFGNPHPRVIPFGPRTADSVDKLVAAVWDYTKGWGIAGRQMYWRPRLELELGESGEGRYVELQSLLADSGLEVVRKQSTSASSPH